MRLPILWDGAAGSEEQPHACRPECGACCIAPSITSYMPKMPFGKPANVRCAHLNAEDRCELFGRPERPACCSGLAPSEEMCGDSRDQALRGLAELEELTRAPSAALGAAQRAETE